VGNLEALGTDADDNSRVEPRIHFEQFLTGSELYVADLRNRKAARLCISCVDCDDLRMTIMKLGTFYLVEVSQDVKR
jgi:hypothetical protein